MPTIFLKHVPFSFSPPRYTSPFVPKLVQWLRNDIAEAAKVPPKIVEIHPSFEPQYILPDSGMVESANGILGYVVWFANEERGKVAKQKIANALQTFLNHHDLGKNFFLTFLDMPAGSFFTEKGGVSVLVEGGEPLPSFQVLTDVAGIVTGFGRDE